MFLIAGGLSNRAWSQTTAFYFTSSPDSFVGRGQTIFLTPTNGFFIAAIRYSEIRFDCHDTNGGDLNWTVDFAARSNSVLTPGAYLGAHRFLPIGQDDGPGLDFEGQGRGNNSLTGYFNVLEVVYDANTNVVSFAADFVQYDEGVTNHWNEGSVRFNSTIPIPQPLLLSSNSATNITLVWPMIAQDFSLYSTTNLATPHWSLITDYLTNDDGMISITLPMDADRKYFRLMK